MTLRNVIIYTDDGYMLTQIGYDFLALRVFVKRNSLKDIKSKIGMGKESDIFLAVSGDDKPIVIKFLRLGRTSFKTIKINRDYLQEKTQWNWFYVSRLSAAKEYAFMAALYKAGFSTPVPIDYNRHCIIMSHVPCPLLANVDPKCIKDPLTLYNKLINTIIKLAEHGLIHCDFNQFNILLDGDDCSKPIIIDFPQMVSTSHFNANEYIH